MIFAENVYHQPQIMMILYKSNCEKNKILLFIPAYNCQDQIYRLISNLKVHEISNFNKIMIIDNLSTDKTSIYAEEAIKKKNLRIFC